MKKNGFTIIEVVVAFLIILGVTFFILPKTLNNTRQACNISKWKSVYSDAEYMFSVIKAQDGEELDKKIAKAANNEIKTQIILSTIKPYLRFKSAVANSMYKQYYMNHRPVEQMDKYFIDGYYYTESENIVGVKWIADNCDNETIYGLIVFDINGIEPPNSWGRDVFGINILKDKITPIGQDVDTILLKNDCSEFGHGLYCSYYYLIGGQFD